MKSHLSVELSSNLTQLVLRLFTTAILIFVSVSGPVLFVLDLCLPCIKSITLLSLSRLSS